MAGYTSATPGSNMGTSPTATLRTYDNDTAGIVTLTSNELSS